MDIKKMCKEMEDYGFDYELSSDDDKMMKVYKCYLSKKCNDEKYSRIKKMFDYVKEDKKFIDLMGDDYKKLCDSFVNESRGEGVKKVEYDGMSIMDVFMNYKLGVKEVCKKGYKVENDIYIKL